MALVSASLLLVTTCVDVGGVFRPAGGCEGLCPGQWERARGLWERFCETKPIRRGPRAPTMATRPGPRGEEALPDRGETECAPPHPWPAPAGRRKAALASASPVVLTTCADVGASAAPLGLRGPGPGALGRGTRRWERFCETKPIRRGPRGPTMATRLGLRGAGPGAAPLGGTPWIRERRASARPVRRVGSSAAPLFFTKEKPPYLTGPRLVKVCNRSRGAACRGSDLLSPQLLGDTAGRRPRAPSTGPAPRHLGRPLPGAEQ